MFFPQFRQLSHSQDHGAGGSVNRQTGGMNEDKRYVSKLGPVGKSDKSLTPPISQMCEGQRVWSNRFSR